MEQMELTEGKYTMSIYIKYTMSSIVRRVLDNYITFQLSRCARIGSPDSGFEKGRNTNLQN